MGFCAPAPHQTQMAVPHGFIGAADCRTWPQAAHAASESALARAHKVGTGRVSLSWSDYVDEPLRFYWVDGVRKRIDAHSHSIRVTARKHRSIWSAINIEKLERLRAQGRILPAGERATAKRTLAR